MVQEPEPVIFVLSQPPVSTPVRSASGQPIKRNVIRAMEAQLRAANAANAALDDMIRVLRSIGNTPPPGLGPDAEAAV